jgi:hypothetical protein
LRDVYVAIDNLIGLLESTFPDAIVAVFAMHGMGQNDGDVPAMVLLPELLYRAAFGVPHMASNAYAAATSDGVPLLSEKETWEEAMFRVVAGAQRLPSAVRPDAWFKRLSNLIGVGQATASHPADPTGISWIPATRYREFWPDMSAFALPAYYDGRVRINLEGREARGLVPADQYESRCREVIDLLRGCRNLLTGDEVVEAIHRPKMDPRTVGPTEADLYVIWKGAPVGFATPGFGDIGPVPYRRTGGHTGERGFLYLAGNGIAAGSAGIISSFDVVPTIIDLLGETRPAGISGKSVAASLNAGAYRVEPA